MRYVGRSFLILGLRPISVRPVRRLRPARPRRDLTPAVLFQAEVNGVNDTQARASSNLFLDAAARCSYQVPRILFVPVCGFDRGIELPDGVPWRTPGGEQPITTFLET